MAETSESIRAALTAKDWITYEAAGKNVEDQQFKSFWYKEALPDTHLQLVEDLTEANKEPGLFIHSYKHGWLPIKVSEIP